MVILTITMVEGLTRYILVMLGLLGILFAFEAWRTRVHHWRVSRVKLCECEECHLLFLLDRFTQGHRYVCPRCGHVNTKRRQSKSPWGETEESKS